MNDQTGKRWSVVLAGGEGERLRPFVTRWLGAHRPKQYCAFLGARSMLEHTHDRAAAWSGEGRVVTVIGRGHWRYLDEPRRLDLFGRVVEQPASRDTGPGLLLPLAYCLAEDPEALAAVFPSDHYIATNGALERVLERAGALARRLEDKIVLLAAVPDRPEREYGWILPAGPGLKEDKAARRVARFVEKPSTGAEALLRRGGLWNTMIMVFKAKAVWSLARALYPELMNRFEVLRRAIGTDDEPAMLKAVYAGMENVNFSRGILERVPERAVVLPMAGVDWCDWGRVEWIQATLARVERDWTAGVEIPGAAAAAVIRP